MKKLDSKKIIMGIDPGTNILGYGVIAIDQGGPELLTLGTLDMRKEKDPFKKLDTIFTDTGKIMDLYRPDYVSIESPFYGKNPQVVLKLGRAQGAAITAALHRGIPVHEYAPRKAKIAITGSGSASKEHLVAYSGKDNEFGRTLKRGLKKTSKSSINPEYVKQNIKQQTIQTNKTQYIMKTTLKSVIAAFGATALLFADAPPSMTPRSTPGWTILKTV